ncbi:MAG: diacylglycerol kinase family protein [Bacteroidetes bacterium]|nr:diacylglycerol kinase family protein [Bacteroidota bacterium]
MSEQKFSIRSRIRSFRFAIAGLRSVWAEEHNARVHLAAAILVVAAGFWFDVSSTEWMSLVFAIGFVITTEIVNTALEKLADVVEPNIDPRIKLVKDLSAAAVLMSVITAVVIGLIVFLPKLLLI